MKHEVTLKNKKKLLISSDDYRRIESDLLSGDDVIIKTGVGVFNSSQVLSVMPVKEEVDVKTPMTNRQKMIEDFMRDEEEYRNETPVEKAKREYYIRFMGMILSVYGAKMVLGTDWQSPSTTEEAWKTGSWEFTEEQRQDRRRRFDRWVENSNYPTLWGKDLKNFLVEYFEINPNKSWCDLEEWWSVFIEGKLPTSRFEKILMRHEVQVRSLER